MPRRRDTESSEEDVDIRGEQDLVEDDTELLHIDPEDDEDFLEEGEIEEEEMSEDEDEYADLIRKYTLEGNIKKLKQILKIKKEKCEQLKAEVQNEQ